MNSKDTVGLKTILSRERTDQAGVPQLPPPPLSFLLPCFHLFQINRVALIQCVSCRLPWRLFDPVFQSLHLGQTCFSSVCCTPALEAAASLRQTMPPLHTHTHTQRILLSPLYLSFSTIFWPGFVSDVVPL